MGFTALSGDSFSDGIFTVPVLLGGSTYLLDQEIKPFLGLETDLYFIIVGEKYYKYTIDDLGIETGFLIAP